MIRKDKTIMSREFFRLGNIRELEKWLETTDYFTAPASTRHHGCYTGGLYEHSYNVAALLAEWTDMLGITWLDRRSPYVVGLLHDVCKIGNYVWNEESGRWVYNTEHKGVGHGTLSVKMIEEQGFKLNDEERACILYHMGTYTADIGNDDGEPNYSQIIERYHNVLWTHTADMYASQILKK